MELKITTLKQALRVEGLFAAAMIAATSLGFVKTAVLAWLLDPVEFGLYLTVLGVGIGLSVLLTFGQVERTYMLYPTYAAKNGMVSIFNDLHWMVKKMVGRFLGLSLLGASLTYLFRLTWINWNTVLIIGFVGLSILLHSLLASVVRAIDPSRLLPPLHFLRGGVALIAALCAYGLGLSWSAILVFECAALLTVFLMVSRYLKNRYQADSSVDLAVLEDRNGKRGRQLWLATLVTAAISYGGRAVILLLSGAAIAGAFGVLMVVVQSGQMVAAALSQRLVPKLVQQELNTSRRIGIWENFSAPFIFLWFVSFLVFVVGVLSFLFPFGYQFWDKYGIGWPLIGLVSLQIAASIYLMLHFAFMAKSQELALVRAALISVSVFYGGFAISEFWSIGLTGYVLSALFADLAHSGYLLQRYIRLSRMPH